MKELYISPEATLIGFVAQERLAAEVDFGDLDTVGGDRITIGGSGAGNPEISQVGDIHLPFPSL